MKRTNLVIVLLLLLVVGGLAFWWSHREPSIPPDMEAATDVRSAVKGKTVNDISKVTIEICYPNFDPIVVTKKEDVDALLKGLQAAVRTKIRYGDSGPRISVYWKDKKEPSYFYICLRGPKQAYGEQFAKAYNHVVHEKEYQVVMKQK